MNSLIEMYQRVTSSNEVYNDHYLRWLFLLESYMGGDVYRKGQHLTRYQLETEAQYMARLASTPLDNHCRSVINVFNSFMFREEPERELGSIELDPALKDFLEDADLEGRDLDSVMKEVSTWASVFGHCYILLSKPNIGAQTRADELAEGVRPYISLLTPLTVYDWTYERGANGRYELVYLKYVEDINNQITMVMEWYPDRIVTTKTDRVNKAVLATEELPNTLGRIPVVIAYNQRSPVRGLGVSDISDIADQQKAIYNELSEIEQQIRLDGHPSLVTVEGTKIGVGAGSVIYVPESTDAGLKPYLLDHGNSSIISIWDSIGKRVDSIDKMANTGAVRATESRTMSGISRQVEFELLNARLAEKSDNLELAEEQMWRIWADYQGLTWDGEIEYPGSFNIRDIDNEYEQLQKAKQAATSPDALAVVDFRLRKMLDDPRYEYEHESTEDMAEYQWKIDEVNAIAAAIRGETPQPELNLTEHPTTTPEDRSAHIQQMIMEGYTDQQILTIHPKITQDDITQAKELLLNL
jgi:hypothetical protein